MGRGVSDCRRGMERAEVSQVSDIIDKGNETADFFLEVAKRNVAPQPEQHGVGMCLNCGVDVPGDARWCGVECRDDWQLAQRRR